MELKETIEKFWDTIIAKDVEEIAGHYVENEETYVILEGPRFSTRGFEKIMKGWGDFIGSSVEMTRYEWIEGPFEEIEERVGWIGGIADVFVKIDDHEFHNRFRITFVMKKVVHDWKIKHEHVSVPMEDPYGIGDWLKK